MKRTPDEDVEKLEEGGKPLKMIRESHGDGEPSASLHTSAVTIRNTQELSKKHSSSDVQIRGGLQVRASLQGWRLARAAHGITLGGCYFEVVMKAGGEEGDDPHARVGWSMLRANSEGPVGFDDFSYAYRDVDGSYFHRSRARPGGQSWGPEDVIGCAIFLHEGEESSIWFFCNGVPQRGPAFVGIPAGTYYPAVSMYGGARLVVNFGPDFAFPPLDLAFQVVPASELGVVSAPSDSNRGIKRERSGTSLDAVEQQPSNVRRKEEDEAVEAPLNPAPISPPPPPPHPPASTGTSSVMDMEDPPVLLNVLSSERRGSLLETFPNTNFWTGGHDGLE